MFFRCAKEQAGLGFTAITTVGVIVITDEEIIQGKSSTHSVVHGLNRGKGLRATRDVGLVRNGNQQEAGLFQPAQGVLCFGEDTEFF